MKLTKSHVQKAFSFLEEGKFDQFLSEYVHEAVQWTITGSSILGGLYTSRDDFILRAISKLNASLEGGIRMVVKQIYIDDPVAIVELEAIAQAKRGFPYNNQYAWILRFEEGLIIEARVYYDDILVNRAMG